MSAASRLVSVALVTALIGGCELFQDPGPHPRHDCQVVRSDGWTQENLALYHDDSRSCPSLATGFDSLVTAGGTIVQSGIGSPNDPGIDSAKIAFLSIHHTNYICQEEAFGDTVASEQADFRRAYWLASSSETLWGTALWAEYTSGRGPDPNRDCPVFRVQLAGTAGSPVVVTVVRYTYYDM